MQVNWHGCDAWQLENAQIRVVIVPELGAKIASLVDRAADHEWLAAPTNPVRPRQYADAFIAHDLGGWDEMFPTISDCPAPHDPAATLPDHGEVWALPWQVIEQSAEHQTLRVSGRQMAYTLTRTARLQPDGLRLEYTVANHSDQPMPFLWAAHPLFNGTPATHIGLPSSVRRVINVIDHARIGPSGIDLDWPAHSLSAGDTLNLDRVGTAARRDYRKFYVPPEKPMAAAWLWQTDIQRALHLAWDAATAPYLGIWVDEGYYTRGTTVALEPGSGYYDSLALAQHNQRVATVGPQATHHWWLTVRLSGTLPEA